MLILKFGGTSVRDAEAIGRVYERVRDRLHRRPVVVVSALAGMTDRLLDLAEKAAQGEPDIADVSARHRQVAGDLGLTPSLLERPLKRLASLLEGIATVGELSLKSLDHVASYGERLSSLLVAAYFARRGLAARPVDAGLLGLVTDARFGAARPLEGIYGTLARGLISMQEVPVVTGFIGRDAEGNVTTLGRNGSDYTAAILGRAVRAEEIQIWTDVDGIMTADPRLVPEARPLREISFEEACELALCGARVVHPASMQPAVDGGLPIRVLNVLNPGSGGTLVLAGPVSRQTAVTAIVHRRQMALLNVVARPGNEPPDLVSRLLEACRRHEVPVELLATSQSSVSAITGTARDLGPIAAELAPISRCDYTTSMATISIVGHGLRELEDVPANALAVLAGARIPVEMLAMTAHRKTFALVVPGDAIERAVNLLHRRFFSGNDAQASSEAAPVGVS